MPKFFKFVACLAVVIGCMVAGGAIGSWWPIRNVPKSEIWAGDGIGILLFGIIGLGIGTVIGVVGVTLILSFIDKRGDQIIRPKPASTWASPDE